MRFALLFAFAPVLCAQEVTKIWDAAPHNAFTDLIRFRGHLYCAFREAPRHGVAPDGKVRTLASGWPGIRGVAYDAQNKRLFAAVTAPNAASPATIRIVPID